MQEVYGSCRADRRHRAHPGRDRHRQGARRQHHLYYHPTGADPSSPSTARPSPTVLLESELFDTSVAPSPAPSSAVSASSRPRLRVRSSWTRLPTCPRPQAKVLRPPDASSPAWAAASPSVPTPGSSRRPTRTWRAPSARPVPRGPLLPAERRPHRRAPAAGAPGRHRRADRVLRRQGEPRPGHHDRRRDGRRARPADAPPLAGQRPRAREHVAAGCRPGAGADARPRGLRPRRSGPPARRRGAAAEDAVRQRLAELLDSGGDGIQDPTTRSSRRWSACSSRWSSSGPAGTR